MPYDKVLSAAAALTVVFGMGTGVSPPRIATPTSQWTPLLLAPRMLGTRLRYVIAPLPQKAPLFGVPGFLRIVQAYQPVGLSGLEPPTSRLSGVRSNRLSYKPASFTDKQQCTPLLILPLERR